MRKFVVVAALLLLASGTEGAMAQYGYPPPPPGYGYGPPPPPPGYGAPRYGYGGPRYGGGGEVCAYENGFCAFNGWATVRYGARGYYVSRQARGGIPCNNRVFGDPAPGIVKHCVIE